MDLRTKLVFAMVVVSLAGMLALGAIAYALAKGRLTERTERQLVALAAARRDDLESLLAGWRDRVSLVASRTQLRRSLASVSVSADPAETARIRTILEDATRSSDVVHDVVVFGRDGRLVARSGPGDVPVPVDSALVLSMADTAVFLGLAGGEGSHVSFLAPLTLDGRRVGALLASLGTTDLLDVTRDTTGMGETGETMVVARAADGSLRVLHPVRHAAPGVDPARGSEELARLALAGEEGPFREGLVDYRGEPVWAATRLLPDAGWGVIVKFDADEEMAPVVELRNLVLGAGLSLSGFAILIGILLGLHFARPIHDLAEVADRFRHGELDARSDLDREDELGVLAGAFNEMGEELERRMTLLQEYKRFFDVSLDLLCIAGTDGYFKRINPAFERVLEWPEEELLGRPFADFVHPEDVEKTVRETDRLGRGIPTIQFENRFRRPDGTYQRLSWTCHPDPQSGALYAVARPIGEEGDAARPG